MVVKIHPSAEMETDEFSSGHEEKDEFSSGHEETDEELDDYTGSVMYFPVDWKILKQHFENQKEIKMELRNIFPQRLVNEIDIYRDPPLPNNIDMIFNFKIDPFIR